MSLRNLRKAVKKNFSSLFNRLAEATKKESTDMKLIIIVSCSVNGTVSETCPFRRSSVELLETMSITVFYCKFSCSNLARK